MDFFERPFKVGGLEVKPEELVAGATVLLVLILVVWKKQRKTAAEAEVAGAYTPLANRCLFARFPSQNVCHKIVFY
jgi:hypothetical protein